MDSPLTLPAVPVRTAPTDTNGKLNSTWTLFLNAIRTAVAQNGGMFFVANYYEGSDIGVKFNAAYKAAAAAGGGTIIILPGQYTTETTLATDNADVAIHIMAYGATISTRGAIDAVLLAGTASVFSPRTLRGLTINQQGDTDALHGINVLGCWHACVEDCQVIAGSNSGPYQAVHVGNTDPANDATGSIWVKLRRINIGRNSAYTDFNYGIVIEGPVNALSIRDCEITNVGIGIQITPYAGFDSLANAVLIDNVAFEALTTPSVGSPLVGRAIWVAGAPTSNIDGMRFQNCRFEGLTTCYSFTGTTTPAACAPTLMGSMLTNVTTYLDNPNNLRIAVLDFSLTPDVGQTQFIRGIGITCQGGTESAVDVYSPGGARGIVIHSGAAGSPAAVEAVWTGSGNNGQMNSAGTLTLSGSFGVVLDPGFLRVRLGAGVTDDGTNLLQVGGGIRATLPTSAAGLPSGSLWNNAGVVNVAP
jgi:hypothetical protein